MGQAVAAADHELAEGVLRVEGRGSLAGIVPGRPARGEVVALRSQAQQRRGGRAAPGRPSARSARPRADPTIPSSVLRISGTQRVSSHSIVNGFGTATTQVSPSSPTSAVSLEPRLVVWPAHLQLQLAERGLPELLVVQRRCHLHPSPLLVSWDRGWIGRRRTRPRPRSGARTEPGLPNRWTIAQMLANLPTRLYTSRATSRYSQPQQIPAPRATSSYIAPRRYRHR